MPKHHLILLLSASVVSLVCYEKRDAGGPFGDTLARAMNQVEDEYFEEIDRRELFQSALSGMMDHLDEHSVYIPPSEFLEFEQTLEQQFGGIGIQVVYDDEVEKLRVVSPLVGTPAYRAGVLAGDQILAVDGQGYVGLGPREAVRQAVRKLRGPPGEKVTLTVQHPGAEDAVDIDLVRDVIEIDTVLGDHRNSDHSWSFRLEDHPSIGFVRIVSFSERTVDELRAALDTLTETGIEALIIDLRYNPGGLLDAAVEMCDLFVSEGTIVSTRGRGGAPRDIYYASDADTLEGFPIVVLANRLSASASEIVAACLQDHDRAVVIGQRTWGKGSVQKIIPLEAGRSAMKLTIATYWRPSGKNIHRSESADEDGEWGVTPDEGFEITLTEDEERDLLQLRRRRDVVGGGDEQDAPEAADLVDPSVKRAIEYLEQVLADKDVPQAA